LTVWPIAHVRVEVFEVAPLLFDTDAATGIVAIARTGTAIFHAAPRRIGTGVALSVLRYSFSVQAAAACRLAATQVASAHNAFSAAIAAATPQSKDVMAAVALALWMQLQDR
jgi:hypothetical protein